MKAILRYKDKVASLGLLPTIITLCGLYFFPTTLMLGFGLAISIVALWYNIVKLKTLNFFLLQGIIGIGLCYILRLLTGYDYLPPKSITPTLDFMLLIGAFIHITAPEIYQSILKKLHLNACVTFTLEAKIIVVLSTLHLLCLIILNYWSPSLSPRSYFLIAYLPPPFIYLVCLIVNSIGIHFAAKENAFRQNLLRIAPICNKKIYLIQDKTSVWDLPIEMLFDGSLRKAEKYATRLAYKHFAPAQPEKPIFPRLILKYQTILRCSYVKNIQLYIFPLRQEKEISLPNGRFFSFEDIFNTPEAFSQRLRKEAEALQMAAEVWKEFESNS